MLRLLAAVSLLALAALPPSVRANGADLPPEIVLQGYIKVEDARLRQLVRIPLVFLQPFALPKRGPGYLDLAKMDDVLRQAAAAAARQMEVREDGVPLVPTVRHARVSLLADRSFQSYDAALAHLAAPPLPVETNLFWNQGFFDTEIEYPIRSAQSHFSVRTNVMPGLGTRVRLQLEFLADGKPAHHYIVSGGSGWVALDPRWYEAAWLFVQDGFIATLSSERLMFLLCLLAPFRQWRSLLVLVLALSSFQALTLSAAAVGLISSTRWMAEFAGVGTAGATLLLAIGNLGMPHLRRRWLLAGVVGALGGFSLGNLLAELGQFAGGHPLIAVVSFNVGAVLGEVAAAAVVFALMRLFFAKVLGAELGVVVLSALLGHQAWHSLIDRSHELEHGLEHAGHAGLRFALTVALLCLIPPLLFGIWAWRGLRRFDGAPTASLLALARNRDGKRAGDG